MMYMSKKEFELMKSFYRDRDNKMFKYSIYGDVGKACERRQRKRDVVWCKVSFNNVQKLAWIDMKTHIIYKNDSKTMLPTWIELKGWAFKRYARLHDL